MDLIEPAPDRFCARFAVALAAEEAAHLRGQPYDFIHGWRIDRHFLFCHQMGTAYFVGVEEQPGTQVRTGSEVPQTLDPSNAGFKFFAGDA